MENHCDAFKKGKESERPTIEFLEAKRQRVKHKSCTRDSEGKKKEVKHKCLYCKMLTGCLMKCGCSLCATGCQFPRTVHYDAFGREVKLK